MINTAQMHIANSTQRVWQGFLDLVLPPRCLSCREIVSEQGKICAACWNQVPFLAGPRCRICAASLDDTASSEPVCEACAFEPPIWERGVAALRYEGIARKLILKFKHGDRTEGAALLAEWMAMAVRPLINSQSLILPVPLHRWRSLARGYNQSWLLAKPIARQLNCETQGDWLWRTTPSRSQQGLNASERQINVDVSQFALREGSAIQGRHVILVDDVLTTGATFTACARLLQQAGAARIDVAALARVVRAENTSI